MHEWIFTPIFFFLLHKKNEKNKKKKIKKKKKIVIIIIIIIIIIFQYVLRYLNIALYIYIYNKINITYILFTEKIPLFLNFVHSQAESNSVNIIKLNSGLVVIIQIHAALATAIT